MRRHHEPGPAAAGPLAQRDHIAFAVDQRVLEAEFLHPLLIIFGTDFFLERRRRNFGDALLFRKSPLVVGLDVVERLDDFGMGENGLKIGRGSHLRSNLSHLRVLREGDKGDGQDRSRECHQKSPYHRFHPALRPASFSRPANQTDRARSKTPPV